MPDIVFYTSGQQLGTDYIALGLIPILFVLVRLVIHHVTRGKGGD